MMSQEFKKKVYTIDDITEPVIQSDEMTETNPTFDVQSIGTWSKARVSVDDDELELSEDQIIILDEVYNDLQSGNLDKYRLIE